MDYEVESEWDWEEEEDPGESLSDGDEDGEEMAGEDGSDCDMDGEGIVPDGYLSADEGCCEEAEMMDMDCGAAEVAGGEGRSFGALTISNSAELKKLQASPSPLSHAACSTRQTSVPNSSLACPQPLGSSLQPLRPQGLGTS